MRLDAIAGAGRGPDGVGCRVEVGDEVKSEMSGVVALSCGGRCQPNPIVPVGAMLPTAWKVELKKQVLLSLWKPTGFSAVGKPRAVSF